MSSTEVAVKDGSYHLYIYDLPFAERRKLCDILDFNDKWEELGGSYMSYDYPTLFKFGKAVHRGRSPTDELLYKWGTQNHTVLDLFILLSKMCHYQAMLILKPFVDPKYHHLIKEEEVNWSRDVYAGEDLKNQNALKTSPRENARNYDARTQDARGRSKLPPIKEMDSKLGPNKSAPETQRKLSDPSHNGITADESCSLLIPYKELEKSTNGWDKNAILGRGGFGIVFKGFWKHTEIAIKRLEPQKGSELGNMLEVQRQQSLKELKYLNCYRHDNILPLYGYSIGGEKPCLVYQFMTNGSLEDRIQCRQGTKPLSWDLRFKIATGTARGLQYLHTLSKPLVHGDIKSANILLDKYCEARIGDFGLAREGPVEQYTHVKVSRVHGTRPYLPDEFLRGKKFSVKVDTYSFGVVLFEIATGLRAYDDSRPQKFLKDYVDNYDESAINDLIDQKAGNDDLRVFRTLIDLGKLCVKYLPKDRPDMVEVWNKLDVSCRAACMVRQSSIQPSKPLDLQRKYDMSRRPSLSPYEIPQQWMFPTNPRSPSPTKQGNGSPNATGVPARTQSPINLPSPKNTSEDSPVIIPSVIPQSPPIANPQSPSIANPQSPPTMNSQPPAAAMASPSSNLPPPPINVFPPKSPTATGAGEISFEDAQAQTLQNSNELPNISVFHIKDDH